MIIKPVIKLAHGALLRNKMRAENQVTRKVRTKERINPTVSGVPDHKQYQQFKNLELTKTSSKN